MKQEKCSGVAGLEWKKDVDQLLEFDIDFKRSSIRTSVDFEASIENDLWSYPGYKLEI